MLTLSLLISCLAPLEDRDSEQTDTASPDSPDSGDSDGDGFLVTGLGGEDCDDTNAAINPAASDIVGDDIDQNCDGIDGTDVDQDGIASTASGGEDCDDLDPGSTTLTEDLDCDGLLDEDDCDPLTPGSTAISEDADCDGFVTAEDCDDQRDYLHPYDADGDGAVDGCGWRGISSGTHTLLALDSSSHVHGISYDLSALNTPAFPVDLIYTNTGGYGACTSAEESGVSCWGFSSYPSAYVDIPEEPAVALAGTTDGSLCAITTAADLRCWGTDTSSRITEAPVITAVDVAMSYYTSCALSTAGDLQCWGFYNSTDPYYLTRRSEFTDNIPTGGAYTDIETSFYAGCALRSDGYVDCWGTDDYSWVSSAPSSTFRKLASSDNNICGIRTDDTIDCWGYDSNIITDVPAGAFDDVSVGAGIACAYRDAEIVCWGDNVYYDPGTL